MAKAGQPTKYNAEYHNSRAYEFCAEFGFTDKQLAKIFDKSEKTINTWKKDHPEFLQSIRAGKDEHDSDDVEKSLRRRALGYNLTERTKELKPVKDGLFSSKENKLIVTKEVAKHMPPDTKAIEFWLRNRRNTRWPDKHEVMLGGELGLNVNEMSEKRKAELQELAALRSNLALKERREDA